MAALRHILTAFLLACALQHTFADEEYVELDEDPKFYIKNFKEQFAEAMVEAKLDDMPTTCFIPDDSAERRKELKKACVDEAGNEVTNMTECVGKHRCCFVALPGYEDEPTCYQTLDVTWSWRSGGGPTQVLSRDFYLGSELGLPGGIDPGTSYSYYNAGSYSVTQKPTVVIQKPKKTVFRFSYSGYRYIFHHTRRTYRQAKQYCANNYNGAGLLEIKTKAMQDYVDERLRDWMGDISSSGWEGDIFATGYWLGGNDMAKEGEWYWETGARIPLTTSYGGSAHQNWYKTARYSEPNTLTDNDDDCLSMSATERMGPYRSTIGKWFDAKCSSRRYYVCMLGGGFGSSTQFSNGRPAVCSSNTCLNGGTCIASSSFPDGYYCACLSGYSGSRCQNTPTTRPTFSPNRVTTAFDLCCSISSYQRRSCGYNGISQTFCVNQLGCCYDPRTSQCFEKRDACVPTRVTTTPTSTRVTTIPPTRPSGSFWLKWSGWTDCSRSCGQGRWTKIRGCMGGRPGSGGCIGIATITDDCNEGPCDGPEGWASWEDWGFCSASCGVGISYRYRRCTVGGNIKLACPGESKQQRECNAGKPCVVEGWASWEDWGFCSASCGVGISYRSRKCTVGGDIKLSCPGESRQQRACNAGRPCVVEGWASWEDWSVCSATCGYGFSYRFRRCSVGGDIADLSCPGESREQKQCQAAIPECIKTGWASWEDWSGCSASCGVGVSFRFRRCITGGDIQVTCPGNNREQKKCESAATCATWGAWGGYSECSVTCGSGFYRRVRICIGATEYDTCSGDSTQTTSCSLPVCRIGTWTTWSTIVTCTERCGGGTTTRIRVCRGGEPGGPGCPGPQRETNPCNTQKCASWTSWGEYTQCSVPCGGGNQLRRRTCVGGQAGQPGCEGERIQFVKCNEARCATWSQWSSEGECRVTCGRGIIRRTRTCLGNGQCPGSATSTVECNAAPCSYWSAWTEFGLCSVTCGAGMRYRTRECQNGRAGKDGCLGPDRDSIPCQAPIPVCITGTWTSWTQTTECSRDCGGGTLTRIRVCTGGTAGQGGCPGPSSQVVSCNLGECKWSPWSRYTACTRPCDGGTKLRTRTCLGGNPGSSGCEGRRAEVAPCNEQPCEVGQWSSWTTVTQCSVTCGAGFWRQIRTCQSTNGASCPSGETSREVACTAKIPICVVSSWAKWSEYSSCSASCGAGTRVRSRRCITSGGAATCPGKSTVSESCFEAICQSDSFWSQWASEACSATCGQGFQIRRRTCIGGEPGEGGCFGEDQSIETCIAPNPTCATWSEWSEYEECSATCGKGVRRRTRTCIGGEIGMSGCDRIEDSFKVIECVAPQPTCSYWGEWSEYESCSADCGGGIRTRRRVCFGDGECVGNDFETKPCNKQACPEWDDWSQWSTCTARCGGGITTRTRQCIGGSAGYKGCQGPEIEERGCNSQQCATWGEWSNYIECSEKCGGGVTTRFRLCLNGEVGEAGCIGPEEEAENCNTNPCESWSGWTTWTSCSVDCGGGYIRRTRTCKNGFAGLGNCLGDSEETMGCNSHNCASWGPWRDGECSTTCGEGIRVQVRECIGGLAGIDDGCEGSSRKEVDCYSGACAGWALWGQWSECSADCGGGEAIRIRSCNGGEAGKDGCLGAAANTRDCNTQACAVWSDWRSWGDCSVTCGGGQAIRMRTCNGGKEGEQGCLGSNVDSEPCNIQVCAQWAEWAAWGECSATCGRGEMIRSRICDGGEAGSSEGCIGPDVESEPCLDVCATWTKWGAWAECAVTCGGGESTRTRICEGGEGEEGCIGPGVESQACNDQVCAKWSEWEEWGDCSVTCGGGEAIRRRRCEGGSEGENGCLGTGVEVQTCNDQVCAKWSEWKEWGECNVTCGGGESVRSRRCEGGVEGLDGCIGASRDTRPCNDQVCAGWSEWNTWGECSATCGGGESVRSRRCEGGVEGLDGCLGASQETRPCNEQVCILWSAWGAWGACSVSCGGGEEIRGRTCDGAEVGDDACLGPDTESRVCNDQICAQWADWGTWGECSATCGGGEAIRTRGCDGGIPGEAGCFGDAIETLACNEQTCPYWDQWSTWVPCDSTCGEGTITRTRECIFGEAGVDIGCLELPFDWRICDAGPCSSWGAWGSWTLCGCDDVVRSRSRKCINGESGKDGCDGLPTEIVECGTLRDVDCPLWSPWSTWSECSATCGGGKKDRSRICINADEGSGCPEGDPTEELDCNPQPCPSWTAWSDWSVCSKTCDGGVRERSRICSEGIPGDIGCEKDDGVGDYHEQPCNEQLCPRFADWSPWSACNATCGMPGVRTHTRRCIGGTVGQLGCEGPVSEDQDCNGEECAIYSPWNSWEACSEPCGGGKRSRARLCINGEAGKKGCEGPASEEEQCNEKPCTSWSEWGSWGACSRTCGAGEKFRIRMCLNGDIGDLGCPDGESVSTQDCATQPCVGCFPDLEIEGIASGSVVCTKGYFEGSECSFACDDGYQLVGLASTTCDKSSADVLQWNQQPPTCTARCSDEADIVFVIDSSSSIKVANFKIVRNFLKAIVKRFRVGPDAALFGALRYNFNVSELWKFNDFTTKEEVLDAIASIPYNGAGTKTGKAINYTREHMFTDEAGRRPGVPRIVVVITDGVSFDDVRVPSDLLKAENTLMVAVGIGNVNIGEINDIASDPDRNFATTVSNFDSLATVVNTIADQIKLCQPVDLPESCPPQALMDLVFIVDSSSSIGADNFEIMRTFIKNVVSKFNINYDAALFGLIIFNRDVDERFQLGDFITTVDVLNAINEIPYQGSGTMTGQAIRFAARNAFVASAGSRPGVPKLAIVITDGKSQDNVGVPAIELKARANVIAIGIEGAVQSELNQIATTRDHVYTTQFSTLSDVLADIASAVCFASRAGVVTV